MEFAEGEARYKRARCANARRDRQYGLEFTANQSNYDFERMFRISGNTFQKLVNLVERLIKGDQQKAVNCSGSYISPVTKVAATIRYLAVYNNIQKFAKEWFNFVYYFVFCIGDKTTVT
jgi:hypothetical protein